MAKIAFLIPRLEEGSGGIRTVLRYAYALGMGGHDCFLYIEGMGERSRAEEEVKKKYGYHFENVFYGWESFTQVDLIVATIWYSASVVRDIPMNCAKAYLVQDNESLFYPVGYEYMMVENSYQYGLIHITVGHWLTNFLRQKYLVQSYSLGFSADSKIYKVLDGIKKIRAICFIYQPDKPRRCSRLGIEALRLVKHLDPDVEIYLYGSSQDCAQRDITFDHFNLGLISEQECCELYNRCSIGLCLSASNPSRIPFEMMSSGLPVVELWRENCLYDFSAQAMSLSEQTPESLAFNILRLLNNQSLLEKMALAAVRDAKNRAEKDEVQQFVSAVEMVISERGLPFLDVEPIYTLPAVSANREWINHLPAEFRRSLVKYSHARFNKLHPVLRNFIAWAAKKARLYLID